MYAQVATKNQQFKKIDANREGKAHHVTATYRDQKYVVGDEIFDMENNGRRKTDLRKAHFGWLEVGAWVEVDHSGQPLHCFDESVSVVSVHVQYCILNYINYKLQHTSMIFTDSFANVCNIVFNLRSLTCLGTTFFFPAGEHPAPQQLGCRENLRNLRLTDMEIMELPSGEHTKSNGKWWFIVDFPIQNGGSFHGKMLVHQRVYAILCADLQISWWWSEFHQKSSSSGLVFSAHCEVKDHLQPFAAQVDI